MDSLASNPRDRKLVSSICGYYTRMRMFDSVIAVAKPSIPALTDSEDEYDVMYPIAYTAQAYLFLDDYDSSARYIAMLKERLHLIDRTDREGVDKFIAGMVYNVLAISSMKTDMDYISALEYLKKSYNFAWSQRDSANAVILLSNIASLYYMKEDTAGLQYARNACGLEKQLNSIAGRMRTDNLAYLASMFKLCGNADSAIFYAEKAVSLSEGKEGYYSGKSLVYCTYGEVLTASGMYDEAEKAYRTAEEYLLYASESTAIRLYMSLGNYNLEAGNPAESEMYYRKALDAAMRIKNAEYTHKILYGLYSVCKEQGKDEEADLFFQRYYEVSSSVFNMRKEQEFNRLILRYEDLKHREELNQKELLIAKERLKNAVILFVAILILLLAGYAFFSYSKSKKMYSKLFSQYSTYRKKLEEFENVAKAKKENESKSMSVLFERLEKMMKDGLFMNKDISLLSVSEMLDSNSSYVSKAINTFSGGNFTVYINSYRINEAMRMLANPEDDTPIKAVCDKVGFGNVTSFYRAFQKETGLSPSIFREQAKRQYNAQNQLYDL